MNRIQLQQLAEERRFDAAALIAAGRWSAAYYLAGYAVECALKACIAKQTGLHDFPDKELALKCYTHRIETLVDVAGLKSLRDADADMKANVAVLTDHFMNLLSVAAARDGCHHQIFGCHIG